MRIEMTAETHYVRRAGGWLPLVLLLIGCSERAMPGPSMMQNAGTQPKCVWNITAPITLMGDTNTTGGWCTVAPPPGEDILTIGLYVPVTNTFDGDAGVSDMAIVENDLFQVGISFNAYVGRQGYSETAGMTLPLGIAGHNPLDFSYTRAGAGPEGVENVQCTDWSGTITLDSLEPMWSVHFDGTCTSGAQMSLKGQVHGCQDGDGGAC